MSDKTLPGAVVNFAGATSTGCHTNHLGIGSMDISLRRPGTPWPWLDLGEIYFASPTPAQYDAAVRAKATPGPDGCAFSNIHRRLSRKQAEYIVGLISRMLEEKFKGQIPADDEIDMLKEQGDE